MTTDSSLTGPVDGDRRESVGSRPSAPVSHAQAASSPGDALIQVLYKQLRAAAEAQLRAERPSHTLQATALVHEAFLKLSGPRDKPWQNEAHFYTAAAQAMRQILLDHAKSRNRRKRGGGLLGRPAILGESAVIHAPDQPENDDSDFVALDDALRRLEARDPRAAQVVHLKYFAGLEIAQVALVLGISERTVKNDWAFAKAWLERELRNPAAPDQSEGELT